MMRLFAPKLCAYASESHSTLPAARALNINVKLLYQWQKAAQQPLPADPQEAAEVRALRAQVRRQAQELEISKKASAIFSVAPTQ
jgi:transposase